MMKPKLASAVIFTFPIFALFAWVVSVGAAFEAGASTASQPDAELLDAEQAFQLSGRLRDDRTIEINFQVADGYYMYRDRFQFAVNGQPLKLKPAQFPPGKMKQDATFGKVVTYRKSVRILLPITNTDKAISENIGLKITSQGCADAGVCYPPLHQQLALIRGSSAIATPVGEAATGTFSRPASSPGSVSDLLKLN